MNKNNKLLLAVQLEKFKNIKNLIETINTTLDSILNLENDSLDNIRFHPHLEKLIDGKESECEILSDISDKIETLLDDIEEIEININDLILTKLK